MPSPIELAAAAAVAATEAVPMVADKVGLSHAVAKADLKPGDHIYVWKHGYVYSHHGIVVLAESCGPDCKHESPRCCGIVHFRAGLGDSEPPRIELASLAAFSGGASICRCHYGVPKTEFYLKRAGSCSTHTADVWPLVVIRALSLIDLGTAPSLAEDSCAPCKVSGAKTAPAESEAKEVQVEYGMLTKNCELLARWCTLGAVSGVSRFRSSETAFSPQSDPGRFFRLGLVAAVPAAAAVATAAAVGGPSSVSAGAPSFLAGAGTLAASRAARELLLDAVRHPKQAADLLSRAMPAQAGFGMGSGPHTHDMEITRRAEQSEALSSALHACFDHLGVMAPRQLATLLEGQWPCLRMCEMLVDALEARSSQNSFECAAVVQCFLDELV
eukprot:gnl/TRDRNA2_/TRDRNA2_80836_c0_seq1.p1 gnl/TRDRNA2_/TRDRNA2_80836_c0~~gnl/TRDRNA2_/TRDRNA2_80836_c0_seq1.p1  ORF type:complete len:386 (-),score=64.77 gnl/TRDRNA2_/TRDRNA2_80836_c0_seq1:195-1352(-)